MVIAVNIQTIFDEDFDQSGVSPDMFAESMGNLDNAAHWFAAIPPGTLDPQTIRAGKPELGGRTRWDVPPISCHNTS